MIQLTKPRLRGDVESVIGMDDHVLLFDTATGQYHRLGPLAAAVVERLDGQLTTAEVAAALVDEGRLITVDQIEVLLEALTAKALLDGDTPARRRRGAMDRLLPRFLLWPGFDRVLAPVVRLLDHAPRVPAGFAAAAVAVVGYAAGFSMLARLGLDLDRTPTVAFLVAVAIQLVSVLLHESWHGIVAGLNGHPIRGLGVALVFWVAPVAYVDRTDSYRVRSRAGRVAIATAGMVSDGWVCGLTAIAAIHEDGLWGQVTWFLLTFQLIMLLANLNPLMPSDTVAAVEAATGLIDVRGRALEYVRHRLLRRELPLHLQRVSRRARAGYLIYGLACVAFAGVVLVGFVMSVVTSVEQAWMYAAS